MSELRPTMLLASAKTAALLVDLSPSTWSRLDSAGKVPAPIRLTEGSVRWRVSELSDWCQAGCPDRITWEADRAAALKLKA